MGRFDEIKSLVDGMEDDFSKFYDKKNAAAGTRVRKTLQDLKNIAQEIRLEVQNQKNAMKAEGGAEEAEPAKKASAAKKAPAAKSAAKAKK